MSIYELVDVKYAKYYIISELTFIMKRNQQRDREFSATRLSYSRNVSERTDKAISTSRVAKAERDRSLTLVCNNCFNKQATREKTLKNRHSTENNGQENQWALLKNGLDPKNMQTHQNQVKKTREYNLQKIQQNQREKQQMKNKKNVQASDQNYFGEGSLKASQINQDKRLELKRQLQNQIAAAKQRRQRQKQEQRNNTSPNFIIETEQAKQRRNMIEQQYKMTLLQQMNFNKYKKMQEQELRGKDFGTYQLPFVKEHEHKWELYTKAKHADQQNAREELKKKRESQEYLRSNYTKMRQLEERERFQNEKLLRQQQSKVQQMRRTMINGYLQELRKQMQENQVKRQKQFQKISQNNNASIIPVDGRSKLHPSNQACGCCSKQFPKTYLTPLHSHD